MTEYAAEVRARAQGGVRERAFRSMKYEHLHRLKIADGPTIAVEQSEPEAPPAS